MVTIVTIYRPTLEMDCAEFKSNRPLIIFSGIGNDPDNRYRKFAIGTASIEFSI